MAITFWGTRPFGNPFEFRFRVSLVKSTFLRVKPLGVRVFEKENTKTLGTHVLGDTKHSGCSRFWEEKTLAIGIEYVHATVKGL